jgi:hypothetical protein
MDRLKWAAERKNETDLLRQAGCLAEQPCEESDPAFQPLFDKIDDLADRITAEIE